MSLSRLALRLSTIEAIRPTASVEPYTAAIAAGDAVAAAAVTWPTLAGAYVYDSRVDPINDLAGDERRTLVSVYTELDNADPGQSPGGPPFKRIIDVVFDTSVVKLGENPAAPGTFVPEWLASDAETEAALDLLDYQIRFALLYGPTGKIWRSLTGRKVTDIQSLPRRTSEEGVPLSTRVMRWKVRVADDCPDAAPAVDLVGVARIPDPLLSVFNQLAGTTYGAAIVAGHAPSISVMPTAVPLRTVGLDMPIADPAGAQQSPPDDVQGSATNLDQ